MVGHDHCYKAEGSFSFGPALVSSHPWGDLETMATGWDEKTEEDLREQVSSPGIVVTDRQGTASEAVSHPRIAAFIWGGKVPPAPTLPFGRWKGAA